MLLRRCMNGWDGKRMGRYFCSTLDWLGNYLSPRDAGMTQKKPGRLNRRSLPGKSKTRL